MPTVSIHYCGWLAEQVFKQNSTLKALGATSKAVYLLSPTGQAVILSFDSYNSPLTCTLDRKSPELRAITPGEVFEISSTSLTHPTVTVQRDSAIQWKEQAPAGGILPASIRLQLLTRAAEIANQQHPTAGFNSLLLPFIHLQPAVIDAFDIYTHILDLYKALISDSIMLAGPAILPLLGLGRGLTPSGDDLFCGLLLFYNRWPALCPLSSTLLFEFNQWVVNVSRERTTSLSASLLELASLGTGDERLIGAVDGLTTGAPEIDSWLPKLLSYGSSSGGDALLGMALAIRTYPDLQFK
jgi:hypothetical protein